MILMHVVGLTVDEKSKTPIVVLQDDSGQELLPIWVGAMEAMAISLGLSGNALPRPLTHDLLLQVLQSCQGRLDSVAITDVRDNTYYAMLYIQHAHEHLAVDCRPSDAIALALRMSVPIHVSPSVLEKAAAARLMASSGEHSALLSPPADIATDMLRQAAMNLWNQRGKVSATTGLVKQQGPRDPQGPQGQGQDSPTARGRTGAGAAKFPTVNKNDKNDKGDDEEQRMAALLRTLEPESSRKM